MTVAVFKMTNLGQEVIEFVADFTGINREKIRLNSTLLGDLGVDGDDGCDLIKEFAGRFGIDLANFQADRHFGPEGMPIVAPFILVWRLACWHFTKRKSTEEASGLIPIRVSDLILMAEEKKWGLRPADAFGEGDKDLRRS